MEKFILANGCALKMSDTEKGEQTLVLIHGYLQSSDIFDDVTRQLKRDLRVVVIDVPGHGISEVIGECHTMEFLADVIHDTLKQLSIESCFIAGHSMGGYIATKFAEKYSDTCKGLIMIHSIFEPDTTESRESREKEIELITAGKKELLVKMNPQKAIAEFHRNRYAELISDLREQAIMTDDEGIIALLNGMMIREDLTQFAKNTKIPILCFWGAHDEFIPIQYAEQYTKQYPHIKSVIMQDSGHMCFIEEEDKFIETIVEFCTTK